MSIRIPSYKLVKACGSCNTKCEVYNIVMVTSCLNIIPGLTRVGSVSGRNIPGYPRVYNYLIPFDLHLFKNKEVLNYLITLFCKIVRY